MTAPRPSFTTAIDEPVPDVLEEIAPEDGMFEGDRAHYFSVGRSALRSIRLAALAAHREEFRSILDFGCGFGRVLRVLKAAYPDAQLTACDLSSSAIAFCAGSFGALPVLSHEDPAQIRIAGRFDLIWCGTMLTNIDAAAFRGFLYLFASLLSRRGLLVFTTHGPFVAGRLRTGDCTYGLETQHIAGMLQDYESTGFAYADYPGEVLSRLGLARYGISISKPSWVLRQLESHPHLRTMMYTEKAWDNHQDSVACFYE